MTSRPATPVFDWSSVLPPERSEPRIEIPSCTSDHLGDTLLLPASFSSMGPNVGHWHSDYLNQLLGRPARAVEWRTSALSELAEVGDEAAELELQPPSGDALANAEAIILRLSDVADGLPDPSIYPTEDGSIEMAFAYAGSGEIVTITCHADGSATQFAFSDGRGRRANYDSARDLPDAWTTQYLVGLTD